MGAMTEVKVPDIGDFKDVPVIEVMVKPGDTVKPEDPLITLESDKATMDVPAPVAGTVKDIKVKVGDKVSEGSADPARSTPARRRAGAAAPRAEAVGVAPPAPTSAPAGVAEVRVPDIGDFKDVPVIEVMVKAGRHREGRGRRSSRSSRTRRRWTCRRRSAAWCAKLKVKVGDKVSEGTVILTLVDRQRGGDSAAAAGSRAATRAAPRARCARARSRRRRGARRRGTSTRRRSRSPTPARACASSRASSASTSAR